MSLIVPAFYFIYKPPATRKNGCSNPQYPTALGPHRRCIAAITLRSAIVTKAIVIKIGSNIINTSIMLKNINTYKI